MDVKYETYNVWTGDPKNPVYNDVRVVNICTLLDKIYGKDKWFNVDYMDYQNAVAKWCHDKNAYFYAAPRTEFSEYGACQKANSEGYSTVVVEDLS